MRAGSKRPRSCFEMDDVDIVGVTEYKEEVFAFRWDIKDFKGRLQSREVKDNNKSSSPVFKNPNDKAKSKQWYLDIEVPRYGHTVSVSLCLVNCKESTRVGLKLHLLDCDQPDMTVTTDHTFTSYNGKYCWNLLKIADLLDPKNKLLEDGTLKISCRITEKVDAVHLFPGAKAESEKYAATRKNCIISDFTNLFKSSALSDVSIQTKLTTLKAHKAILSCRSSFFEATFRNKMSESINNTVKFLEFDHVVVKAILKYIYCGEISQDCLSEHSHAIFRFAHMYDINGLKEYAGEYIIENLSIKNAVDSLIFADQFELSSLKAKAVKIITTNKAKLTGEWEKIMKYKNNGSLLLELFNQTY